MKQYEVTIIENWAETQLDYQMGNSHAEVAAILPSTSKRVFNARFREIEKTGKYYRITENCKGGKSFIFEIS